MYKLLIVDDEYPARQLMRMMVEALPGYTVTAEAENGEKALALYRRLRPDIVLTDIEMPVMNGLDLIEAIRAEKPGQPIIILSCYESFTYAQRAMRAGVRDYLIKDMTDQADLQRCLDDAVARLPAEPDEPLSASDDADTFDKLRKVSPIGIKRLEASIDRLFTSFFKHEADNCLAELKQLYHFNVTGMVQYRFLLFINATLVRWISMEMKLYILPPTDLFGTLQTPESQLTACATSAEMCNMLCRWIQGWMRLAEEKQPVSLRTKKIVCYIVDHYAEDISLEIVARQLYVHPVHISRVFKNETNANFTEALNVVRVEKAKLLLAMGKRVNEVAYAVGYGSVQGFHSAFKKLTGLSPADYGRSIQ